MFCKNCGNQIDENAQFCAYCGKPTQQAENVMYNNMPPEKKKKSHKALIIVLSVIAVLLIASPFVYSFAMKQIIKNKVEDTMQTVKEGPTEEDINDTFNSIKKELKSTYLGTFSYLVDVAQQKLKPDYIESLYDAFTQYLTYTVDTPERVSKDHYSVTVKIKNVDIGGNLKLLVEKFAIGKLLSSGSTEIPDAVRNTASELKSDNKYIEGSYVLDVVKKNDKWRVQSNDSYTCMILNCFGIMNGDNTKLDKNSSQEDYTYSEEDDEDEDSYSEEDTDDYSDENSDSDENSYEESEDDTYTQNQQNDSCNVLISVENRQHALMYTKNVDVYLDKNLIMSVENGQQKDSDVYSLTPGVHEIMFMYDNGKSNKSEVQNIEVNSDTRFNFLIEINSGITGGLVIKNAEAQPLN